MNNYQVKEPPSDASISSKGTKREIKAVIARNQILKLMKQQYFQPQKTFWTGLDLTNW